MDKGFITDLQFISRYVHRIKTYAQPKLPGSIYPLWIYLTYFYLCLSLSSPRLGKQNLMI
jgi:hypothetical protein